MTTPATVPRTTGASRPLYPHLTRQNRTQLLQSVAFTVGVGKTHLATALGHIAVRRRVSVLMLRADAMFKRLKAARLDNSVEAEMRRLAQVQLLLIDDFALQPLDATQTADFYELVVARHRTSLHRDDLQPRTR